jgi:hypothetical protein
LNQSENPKSRSNNIIGELILVSSSVVVVARLETGHGAQPQARGLSRPRPHCATAAIDMSLGKRLARRLLEGLEPVLRHSRRLEVVSNTRLLSTLSSESYIFLSCSWRLRTRRFEVSKRKKLKCLLWLLKVHFPEADSQGCGHSHW